MDVGTTSTWADTATARRYGVNCGKLSGIGSRLIVETPVSINTAHFAGPCSIGYLSYVGPGSTISCTDIGRYCSVGPNVNIGPSDHPLDWLSTHPFQYDGTRQFDQYDEYQAIATRRSLPDNSGRTSIGNDVLIGEGAFIKRGVTIGDGAVIGARAVVTRDVDSFCVVVGNPSRTLRQRFPSETVDRIIAMEWWNYDLSPLKGKLDFADIHRAIDAIEDAVAKSVLPMLTPRRFELVGGAALTATRL